MPNVKPAWLTLAILMFQQLWGTTGGMFIRSEQLRPLNFALLLITQGGVPARAGASAVVGLIIMAVPITFFIISQSNIIETMATSGMKE